MAKAPPDPYGHVNPAEAHRRLYLNWLAGGRHGPVPHAPGGTPEADFTIRIDQLADGRYVAHIDEAGREIRTLPAEPTYGKAHALALSKVATIVADRR